MRLRAKVIVGIAAAAYLSAPMRAWAAPVEPLTPPAGTVASAPSVGSLTYVTSLDHLAQLTREDDLLHARAVSLAKRAWLGTGVLMGSAALGALILASAATIFTRTECTPPAAPPGFALPVTPSCHSSVNTPLAVAGMFTFVIGGAAGLALAPSQTEGYEIINAWNARHPDRSLLVPPRRSRH